MTAPDATPDPAGPVPVATICLPGELVASIRAELAWRGFALEPAPGGREGDYMVVPAPPVSPDCWVERCTLDVGDAITSLIDARDRAQVPGNGNERIATRLTAAIHDLRGILATLVDSHIA